MLLLKRSFSTSNIAWKSMRAILVKEFGGPEVIQLSENVPIPEPNDDQIQIKVHSVGLNPLDTYIRSGTHMTKPKLPYTPGFDCSGVITKIGKNVEAIKKLKIGDRVFTHDSDTGTCAEYTLSKSRSVFKLPDNLNFYEGSALGIPYLTAYKSLFSNAMAKPGEVILVHGASGSTGIACVQIAKAHGMHVLGTAGTIEGENLVRRLGADEVYNHREDDYIDKIIESHPDGIDVILEMNGQNNLGKDLDLLRTRRGRIVVIGCRGSVEINPRVLMNKNTSISGVHVYNTTNEELDQMSHNLQALIKLNAVKPIIARVYKLEETAMAHRDLTYNDGKLGRLAIHVS